MAVKYSGLLRFTDGIKAEINLAADGTVEKAVIIDGDGDETPIGGGGDTDFTTAEVKVINNTESVVEFSCPNIYTEGSTEALGVDSSVGKNAETTITAVLYKGKVKLLFWAAGISKTATGDIEISGGDAIISGDGTITVSAS